MLAAGWRSRVCPRSPSVELPTCGPDAITQWSGRWHQSRHASIGLLRYPEYESHRSNLPNHPSTLVDLERCTPVEFGVLPAKCGSRRYVGAIRQPAQHRSKRSLNSTGVSHWTLIIAADEP